MTSLRASLARLLSLHLASFERQQVDDVDDDDDDYCCWSYCYLATQSSANARLFLDVLSLPPGRRSLNFFERKTERRSRPLFSFASKAPGAFSL